MTKSSALLIALVVLFALGSGFGMGWHVQAARVDQAHRALVAWADSTGKVSDELTNAIAKAAIAAKVAAAQHQAVSDSLARLADGRRQQASHWRTVVDSLKQFPIHDTVLVAAQDSQIVALTAENTDLRASLSAAIRAAAQYQIALAASDSALTHTRLRVAALDSAIRAVPPVVSGRAWFHLSVPKPVTFLAGVGVALLAKRVFP